MNLDPDQERRGALTGASAPTPAPLVQQEEQESRLISMDAQELIPTCFPKIKMSVCIHTAMRRVEKAPTDSILLKQTDY